MVYLMAELLVGEPSPDDTSSGHGTIQTLTKTKPMLRFGFHILRLSIPQLEPFPQTPPDDVHLNLKGLERNRLPLFLPDTALHCVSREACLLKHKDAW